MTWEEVLFDWALPVAGCTFILSMFVSYMHEEIVHKSLKAARVISF